MNIHQGREAKQSHSSYVAVAIVFAILMAVALLPARALADDDVCHYNYYCDGASTTEEIYNRDTNDGQNETVTKQEQCAYGTVCVCHAYGNWVNATSTDGYGDYYFALSNFYDSTPNREIAANINSARQGTRSDNRFVLVEYYGYPSPSTEVINRLKNVLSCNGKYSVRFTSEASFPTDTTYSVSGPRTYHYSKQAVSHSWGTPTYTWTKAEDGSWSCTAERVCSYNNAHVETETVKATSEITTPATCESEGTTAYTAKFTNEAFATQTKEEQDIPALGHDWGEPTYTWTKAEDGTWSCEAKRVCTRDDSHAETETVKATSEVTTPATVGKAGITTYTATFTNSAFTTQTKAVEDVPALEPEKKPEDNTHKGGGSKDSEQQKTSETKKVIKTVKVVTTRKATPQTSDKATAPVAAVLLGMLGVAGGLALRSRRQS